MLTYMLAHIVNGLLFAGVFGATFVLNDDDDDNTTTSTNTASDDPDDGSAENLRGGTGDDF